MMEKVADSRLISPRGQKWFIVCMGLMFLGTISVLQNDKFIVTTTPPQAPTLINSIAPTDWHTSKQVGKNKPEEDISESKRLKQATEKDEARQHRPEQHTAPPKRKVKYPTSNVLEEFPTEATREEARRHDRVIVEGMAFFESIKPQELEELNLAGKKYNASDLCINIFTSNRKLRYVDSLLMMLLKGQSIDRLLSFAQINLLNMERRTDRVEYPHLRHTLSRLTFLNIYNLTEMHPLGPDMPFLTALRLDTITALDICIESKLPFCLMFEDDAITPMGFIDQLEKVVIEPWRKGKINASSVSLYSYHSHAWSKTRIDKQKYVESGRYDAERSKMNDERRSEGLDPYEPDFQVRRSRVTWGAVANVYTLEMAQKLRNLLASYGTRRRVANADLLMNNKFPKTVKLPRMAVEPSLVNHIGFYSERRDVVSYMNSDVRFVLDAGKY